VSNACCVSVGLCESVRVYLVVYTYIYCNIYMIFSVAHCMCAHCKSICVCAREDCACAYCMRVDCMCLSM